MLSRHAESVARRHGDSVRISHTNTTFTALGRVVFLFPNMGMGVMFTSVDANQQAVLQKWLEELGRGEG
jgi:hypothetical protein